MAMKHSLGPATDPGASYAQLDCPKLESAPGPKDGGGSKSFPAGSFGNVNVAESKPLGTWKPKV